MYILRYFVADAINTSIFRLEIIMNKIDNTTW